MSGQLAFAKVEALKRDGKQEKDWDEKLATDYALKRIRHSSPIQEAINLERQQIWWSDYSRYLESEEWKERSAGIIARAHGLCEKCGKRKAIHVHHLSYDRVGEERETDLQALCFQCHDEIHDGMLTIDRIHEEIMREISLEAPTLAAEAGALVATASAFLASAVYPPPAAPKATRAHL
jgi:hypothetical protein